MAVVMSAAGQMHAQLSDHRAFTQSEIKQMIADAHTAQ